MECLASRRAGSSAAREISAVPLKDWNLPATWDAAYSIGAEGDTGHSGSRPEVKLGYHRRTILRRRAVEALR